MCAGVIALSGVAWADASREGGSSGGGWKVARVDGIAVRLRPVEGTSIHEVWVETVLDAGARDLQDTLTDPEQFRTFMPHLKEARYLGPPGRVSRVYTLLDPPVVGMRDYVCEVKVLEEVGAGGRGRFRQTWRALADLLPERHGVVRLKHNQGSWQVTPRADGRSHVIYRFSVEPGGWVPGMVAEMGARRGVVDTLRAVEREAQRRATERAQAGAPALQDAAP